MRRRWNHVAVAVLILLCRTAVAEVCVVTRPEEFANVTLETTHLVVEVKGHLPEARPYRERDLAFLAHLTKLRCLDLSKAGAQAHGRDGVGMSKWDLRLTDRGLAYISKARSLESLTLTDTPRITEEGLRLLARGLPRLRYLAIRHWGDYGMKNPATLKSLKLFKSLERLILDGCRGEHEDTWTGRIAAVPGLEGLDLRLCPWVRGGRLTPLAGLTKLRALGLEEVSDDDLLPLASFPALRCLEIRDSREVTGPGLSALSEMGTLRSLILWGCKNLENDGLAHIAGLTDLRLLNLPGSGKITDDGLRHIRELTSLEELHLGGHPTQGSTYYKPCRITDSGICHLVALTRLKRLSLCGVKYSFLGCRSQEQGPIVIDDPGLITDKGLEILREFPALEFLDITHCLGITEKAARRFMELRPECRVLPWSE